MSQVNVIATGIGYSDGKYRNVGDTFLIDSKFFDKKPVLDKDGKPTTQFRAAPSWFERAVPKQNRTPEFEPESQSRKGPSSEQIEAEKRDAFGPDAENLV